MRGDFGDPGPLVNALLCCFSEQAERTIEEGREMLITDGKMFVSRSALSISMIRDFCDANLPRSDHNWIQYMGPTSGDPVVGFDSEDLGNYENANEAARRFVIENVYEVLFPEQRGMFK